MTHELRLYYTDAYLNHMSKTLANIMERNIANDIYQLIKTEKWPEMSLKTRMFHLTDILDRILAVYSYDKALHVLKRLLPQISIPTFKYADMLSMFIPEYVVRRGMNEWDASMEALSYFTSHGTSSEFAIRPFLIQNQSHAFCYIEQWAKHSHPHIRRLASEGCRPRLPWAMALPQLKKDPSPILPILNTLKADQHLFVKKSVANNLNDISKDHPEQAVLFAQNSLGKNNHTNWIIKHGMRTLLKSSHPKALSLFDYHPITFHTLHFCLQTDTIRIGDALSFSFSGHILNNLPPILRIEYEIAFLRKNGSYTHKRYKIKECTPISNEFSFYYTHSFRPLTTRTYYKGIHHVHIYINGNRLGSASFMLMP